MGYVFPVAAHQAVCLNTVVLLHSKGRTFVGLLRHHAHPHLATVPPTFLWPCTWMMWCFFRLHRPSLPWCGSWKWLTPCFFTLCAVWSPDRVIDLCLAARHSMRHRRGYLLICAASQTHHVITHRTGWNGTRCTVAFGCHAEPSTTSSWSRWPMSFRKTDTNGTAVMIVLQHNSR